MIRINRLFLVQTGTYNDMVIRPYDTSNMRQQHLLQLQEASQGGRNLAARNIAGIAGQIVRPSATPQGVAPIALGWDQPRFLFFLEVVEPDSFGGEQVQYLSGYTNHLGVANGMGGMHLDPNMELFFNTSITTRRLMVATPLGNQLTQRVNEACHVMSGTYNPSYGGLAQATHLMRPQDVFDAVASSTLQNFNPTAQVFDTRTAFSGQYKLKKSVRGNVSAPSYLSRLLTTHQSTMADAPESDDLGQIMSEAAGAVREPGIQKDNFLQTLTIRTQLQKGGSVTYRELCQLQEGLEHIVEVVLAQSPQAKASWHQRGLTEHWGGNSHEFVMATILTHAVPALMMELMISKVGFHATNRTLNGQTEVLFTAAKTFTEGLDMDPFLQALRFRLQTEVLADLSQNGVIDYEIQAVFDVMGETSIKLSVGGQPAIDFVAPSFADALFAPILTTNQTQLAQLANDVTTLAESLQTNYAPMSPLGVTNQMEMSNAITGAL